MMIHAVASKRLLSNDAIASLLYSENENSFFQSENVLTVIDIFPSSAETRNAILELRRQGLHSSQIVIITKNYQEYENSINYEYVTQNGDLLKLLIGLRVDTNDISRYENAVKNGKFLLAAIIVNQSVSQAQHLLQKVGHKVISVY